jgi:hypothetical protein
MPRTGYGSTQWDKQGILRPSDTGDIDRYCGFAPAAQVMIAQ